MTTHRLHKTLKGKKSQVTFNPTTTTIPQPKMSYYPQQQQQQQYQSPQTYTYGQMPTYQPQATWSGYDYYNAHSGSGNRTEYDSLWSRLRRTFGTKGYTRSDAKRCFRIVYGDRTDIHQFSKTHYRDLGAAVGYQAIRVWEHQHNTYRIPLSSNREQEREQLAGLAIAEASKLWDRWNPHEFQSSRREKCIETAVATAEYIFDHQYDRGDNHYEAAFQDQSYHPSSSHARTRANSYAAYPEDQPRTPGYSRSRRNSTVYGEEPTFSSRSRRNSMAYGSQPIVTSQPIPVQPTYQNINGYTVASSYPQSPYMGGGPPSPNPLHMGLSSSPGGQYPYVPPQQPMMQGQLQYQFPGNQNFSGYNMGQQPPMGMGMSPPEQHAYMPTTPATPYRRRARSFNYNGGSY